jgi:hypothetical protein
MLKRLLFVIFILFCLEVGAFLVILPWSVWWDRNVLFSLLPGLRPYLASNYARGALSGLGLVNIWVGLSDIWHFRANLAELESEDAQQAKSEQLK